MFNPAQDLDNFYCQHHGKHSPCLMPKLLEKTFVDKTIGTYPGVILSLPWKPNSNFIQISAVIVPQVMSPD